MSGFDDLYREFADIPLGVSSAFMVELHRPTAPPPRPFLTKTARAGLLRLRMIKLSQGDEAAAAALQQQALAQEQAMQDPAAQAMVDPAVQQALDYQQAVAERAEYEQQLTQMSAQLQETEQRAQMAEQQSAQMQQAQQDTQQQLMMSQEQANAEAAGKQEAMQQAVMAKDENLQSQMAAADKREQLVATADQLKEQLEQLKQMAAVNPVAEQQAMQQQQQAMMQQPDPSQPAEVQKQQQQAINAQQEAAVQGDQAAAQQDQEAQKQEMAAQQQQAAAQQAAPEQMGMPPGGAPPEAGGGGMVAQSAHGMGKVDYLKAKLAAAGKCKCGAMYKKGMTKCSCGALIKAGAVTSEPAEQFAGRSHKFVPGKLSNDVVRKHDSPHEQQGSGSKIRKALKHVVQEKQRMSDTPIEEFLGVEKQGGWKAPAALIGGGAALGGGAGAVKAMDQLEDRKGIATRALKGAGLGAAAGLGATGAVKGIGALAKRRAAAKATKEVVEEAPKKGGKVRRLIERAKEVGGRHVKLQSPLRLEKASSADRLYEVIAARRAAQLPFEKEAAKKRLGQRILERIGGIGLGKEREELTRLQSRARQSAKSVRAVRRHHKSVHQSLPSVEKGPAAKYLEADRALATAKLRSAKEHLKEQAGKHTKARKAYSEKATRRGATVVGVGTGAAGLGTAGYLYHRARKKKEKTSAELPKTAVSWKGLALMGGGMAGGGAAGAALGTAESRGRDPKKESPDEIDKKYKAMAAKAKSEADPTYLNKVRAAQAEREYKWERAGREHPTGHVARRAAQGAVAGGLGLPAAVYTGKKLVGAIKAKRKG